MSSSRRVRARSVEILLAIGHDLALAMVVNAVDQFTDVARDLVRGEALVAGKGVVVHQRSEHVGFHRAQ